MIVSLVYTFVFFNVCHPALDLLEVIDERFNVSHILFFLYFIDRLQMFVFNTKLAKESNRNRMRFNCWWDGRYFDNKKRLAVISNGHLIYSLWFARRTFS